MDIKHPQEERLKNHFHSPDEKLITILGRGYLQSFISGYGLTKGIILLTDRRLYQRGKRYIRNPRGGWSLNLGSAVVDVDDITGTNYYSHNPFGLLVMGIIFGIMAIAFLYLIYNNNGELEYYLYGTLIFPALFIVSYFLQQKRLFMVEYGGGSIALDANWFSKKELEEFQKHISLLKGSRTYTTMASREDKFGQPTQLKDPLQVLKSRLVEGEITTDEYRKMKSILED